VETTRTVTGSDVAVSYQGLGAQLGVMVAPAGLAFARSLSSRPALQLYLKDGHPTVPGTYLAACVLYGTMFGRSPVGNPYAPQGVTADSREFLQGMARDTLGY
jgi:hypothetical protein